MSSMGVALAAFALWAAYRLIAPERIAQPLAWIFITACTAISAFCLVVGGRLFFLRRNQFGSAMKPAGWRFLGIVFYLMAAFQVLTEVRFGEPVFFVGVAISCGLGWMTFRVSSRVASKETK